MLSPSPPDPDRADRALRLLLRVVPPAMLLVSTVFVAAVEQPAGARLAVGLGLSAACGAWLLVGRDLAPARRAGMTPLAVLHFLVLTAISAGLVLVSPTYGFYAWTGYFFAARLTVKRAIPLVVLPVACTTALSQVGSSLQSGGDVAGYLLLIVVNASVASAVMWGSFVGQEQNEERRAALDDLTAAHEALSRTVAEKEALQQQLVEGARRAGVQEERARMAREIHDTIAQGLVGIITQLEAAGQDDRRDRHDAALQLARDGLAEARRSVQALRPQALRGARLPEAVATVARDWSARQGVPAEVTTTGTAVALRPELEVALLRATQEALANVGRHARASRVGITLSYMGDVVTLDVRDDGIGFDAGAREAVAVGASDGDGVRANGTGRTTADGPRGAGPAGGFGLIAMRERLEDVDGGLTVESAPGDGVALSATVPARPAEGTT